MKRNKANISNLVITDVENKIKMYSSNEKIYEYLKRMVKEDSEDLLEIQRINENIYK